jgi:hypothetical protein
VYYRRRAKYGFHFRLNKQPRKRASLPRELARIETRKEEEEQSSKAAKMLNKRVPLTKLPQKHDLVTEAM